MLTPVAPNGVMLLTGYHSIPCTTNHVVLCFTAASSRSSAPHGSLMTTLLGSLIAAQTSGPDLTASYYFLDDANTPIQADGATIVAKIDAGYAKQIVKAGDQAWKAPGEYGFIKTVVAAVIPPTAPAAPAAPAAPPAAPVVPTAPALPAAPAATSTPPFAVGAPRADAKNPGFRELAPMITSTDEARSLMASFMAPAVAGPGTSLREAMDNDGGQMSHSLPFCNLKKGNWTDTGTADKPAPGAQYLPAGTRPYSTILLGYRYAATGWKGDASNDGSKASAPLYRFVLPTLEGDSGILPLVSAVTKIARKIQYTGRQDRAKFDALGRMTLETQVLIWVPNLPLGLLCVSGWEAANLTSKSVDDAVRAGQRMQPFSVTVGEQQEVNDNKVKMREKYLAEVSAAKAANRACALKEVTEAECSWTTKFGKFTLDTGAVGTATRAQFQDWIQNEANLVSLANTVKNFNTGRDYNGLSVEEIGALVAKYAPLVD